MSSSNFFHTHTHSKYSSIDAFSDIKKLAARAKRFGQPGLGLTDHGNMSGSSELYRACLAEGILPFPGLEGYLVEDVNEKNPDRYHIGMLSLTLDGYRGLMGLTSATHTRPNFNRFPRMDLAMLAQLSEDKRSEDIAVLTGCYFGFAQQTLVTKGYDAAKRVVEMYAHWFPRTFVELQNHNIIHEPDKSKKPVLPEFEHDSDICEAMFRIAQEVGLPVLITQDSHYLDEKDKPAHELMKRMGYRNGEKSEFPGDSFHFASTWWVAEHHERKHWRAAEEGYRELLDAHDLQIPALDKFTAHIPSTVQNPRRTLRRLVYEGLDSLEERGLLKKSRAAYEKQVEHELSIINDLKMAGYFTLWIEIVEWLKKNNVAREARGSANSSLVCYTLDITSADPMQWGLTFERFLSRDRKKPPDIDMDIEDARRPEVIAWLRQRFGCVQIGTFASLGAREGDDKGSVLVSYQAYLRAQYGPEVYNQRFGKRLQRIADVAIHSRKDYRGLRQLSKHTVTRSYGTHASGLLLNGDHQRISDYIPTMLVASSNTMVTQMTGDETEEHGFLKLDILGQRTLTAMKRCQEMILEGCEDGLYDQDEIGITDDPTNFLWIPLDDRLACASLREGRTETGIFQFEGYAMARGGRMLGVRSTKDCITAGALFRPAVMDSGMMDLYLERRKNPSLKAEIEYPHPAFERALKETNGIVLFQEQVLQIMRELGLDYEGINTFFKIVKDSGKGATDRNKERAAEVHKQWADICQRNGIDDPDAAWHYIDGYTKYGFNKAHATGYGLRSYRAAWLKTYFPLEYMAAILETTAGTKKEPAYVKEARRVGIRLLPPDVNVSREGWTIDRNKKNAVRKGLLSIKGIGKASAEELCEKAPYESVEDMIERVSGKTLRGARNFTKTGEWAGALNDLREAGALTSLGFGRSDYE